MRDGILLSLTYEVVQGVHCGTVDYSGPFAVQEAHRESVGLLECGSLPVGLLELALDLSDLIECFFVGVTVDARGII